MSAAEPRRGSRALILVNLGSPEGDLSGPSEVQVREYLREFLMDPNVIDLPFPLRWGLVHGMILRTRPLASMQAYRKIWTSQGSPLRAHLSALVQEVRACQEDSWIVLGAMRYGTPSIREALEKIPDEPDELVLFPLYPQFARSTTGSTIEAFSEEARRRWPERKIAVRIVRPFYDHDAFLDPFAKIAREHLARWNWKPQDDAVLFSFHGLPERHLRRESKNCLAGSPERTSCCERLGTGNQHCYRAQCLETARLLAKRLELAEGQFHISFQSRLGRSAWIPPHTDETLARLARSGVKRVAVLCPSFVSDCLETLEELGIRGREQFRAAGGEELHLIPCLNSDPDWARGVVELAHG